MATKLDMKWLRCARLRLQLGLAVVFAFSVAFPIHPQNPQDVRNYVQKARAAYREKNYPALIENMKAALAIRPNFGAYIYSVAVGYALSGNKQEALNWLNRLADLGLVYAIDKEADFDSIKGTDEFKAILAKIETNRKPIGHSTTAFTIHEKGLVPEGIAYDPVEKTFYVGSVYKRKIVSVNAAGEAANFSSEADGLWSVMGMRVDASRRLLWVCTAAHQQMMNFSEAEKGRSGVFKYDLRTRKLIKKYLLPETTPHWLGDLVLDSRGQVFASDSISPAIYFLNPKTDQLEEFLASDKFVNPQGLAFSADEKHLFMADYLKGVWVIDTKTRAANLLDAPTNITMLGFDGLYSYKGKLIGVQNGVKPNRLVQMTLNNAGTAVQRFEILEANNPVFDEPTLATITGGALFYIANSQWGAIDEKGNLAPEEKLHDPVILKLKL